MSFPRCRASSQGSVPLTSPAEPTAAASLEVRALHEARNLRKQFRLEEAVAILKHLAEHLSKTSDIHSYVEVLVELAKTYESHSRSVPAIATYHLALETTRSSISGDALMLSSLSKHLSSAYCRIGRMRDALRHGREAYEISLSGLGADNEQTARTLAHYGALLLAVGDRGHAELMLSHAIRVFRALGPGFVDDALEVEDLLREIDFPDCQLVLPAGELVRK